MIPQITIKIFLRFFQQGIRKSGKSINFKDKKINKSTFNKNKKLFNMDVNKILVSKKESFIGYNDDEVIRPLCIKLNQLIGYARHFDANMTMPFKVGDDKLLKKYNKIWEKVSNLMNIEFDSEPVYGDGHKYIKTKIKVHGCGVSTNFHSIAYH